MANDDAPVLRDRRDAVTILTLNRPHRLNAVSAELYTAVAAALDDLDRDHSTRAIVITGAGRAFSAGADLKAHAERDRTDAERREYVAGGQRAVRSLYAWRGPVVAAVNGPAVGAGLELALAADLVVVADDARLRFPEVALGTFVTGGVTHTLVQRVGVARAKELLFLADFFTGGDAVRWGLANRATPAAEVLPNALALAARLAEQAPVSLRLAKALLNRGSRLELDAALELEADALLSCMRTRDWREGIAAFAENRAPRFRGE